MQYTGKNRDQEIAIFLGNFLLGLKTIEFIIFYTFFFIFDLFPKEVAMSY